MNFSKNTPTIHSIVKIKTNGWLIEAVVIARNTHPEIGDQIYLSNGSSAHYFRRTGKWDYWINGDASKSSGCEIEELKYIF